MEMSVCVRLRRFRRVLGPLQMRDRHDLFPSVRIPRHGLLSLYPRTIFAQLRLTVFRDPVSSSSSSELQIRAGGDGRIRPRCHLRLKSQHGHPPPGRVTGDAYGTSPRNTRSAAAPKPRRPQSARTPMTDRRSSSNGSCSNRWRRRRSRARTRGRRA